MRHRPNSPSGLLKITGKMTNTSKKFGPEANLGRTLETFAPPSTSFLQIGGIGVGLMLAGIGVAIFLAVQIVNTGGRIPAYHDRNLSWFTVALGAGISVAATWGGWVLMGGARLVGSMQIDLCEHGFRVRKEGNAECVPWSSIALIQDITTSEAPLLLKGAGQLLVPKEPVLRIRVLRKDGEEHVFHPSGVHDLPRFTLRLNALTRSQNIPWQSIDNTA
jgi:hypothetical protein